MVQLVYPFPKKIMGRLIELAIFNKISFYFILNLANLSI